MNLKSIYESIVESLRFSTRIRRLRKFRNPEDRQFMEDFLSKRKKIIEKNIQEEQKKINQLKDTYEYKVYNHYKKNEFHSSKKFASDFLKFCNFEIFNKKEKWTNSFFFIRPYSSPKDYEWTKFKKFSLIFLMMIMFKVGFSFGFKDSLLYDEIKENVSDIRNEDELFYILRENKLPLLTLYYIPGDVYSHDMQFAMGSFIQKYGNDYVKMAKINCKYNLDLCIKKAQYLKLPQWELMLPGFVN
jgi:hypothetical protein